MSLLSYLVGNALDRFSRDEAQMISYANVIWTSTREDLSSWFASITCADKPAHARSLISALPLLFTILKGSYLNLLQDNFLASLCS